MLLISSTTFCLVPCIARREKREENFQSWKAFQCGEKLSALLLLGERALSEKAKACENVECPSAY